MLIRLTKFHFSPFPFFKRDIALHYFCFKILLMDSDAEDWRVAINAKWVIRILLEIAVCAICPLPGKLRIYVET